MSLVVQYVSISNTLEGRIREIGRFEMNLSYLQGTDHLKEKTVTPDEPGQDHYVLEYCIELEMIQNNLYWHAHLVNESEILPGSQGQFNMVTSFVPRHKYRPGH
jgi:hypothetical protein